MDEERRKSPIRLDPELETIIRETHLLLTDVNVGLCTRTKALEKTVNGNGSPGLAETVRAIQYSSDKRAAFVSGGITLAVIPVWEYIKFKMEWK